MRASKTKLLLSGFTVLAFGLAACGNGAEDAVPGEAIHLDDANDWHLGPGEGATTVQDVFGEMCGALPRDPADPGSLEGMSTAAVATAAGNNPLLQTFAAAIAEAGLVESLEDATSEFTVFAPTDDAFDALGEDTLDQTLASQEQLTSVLTYHVVPERYDREAILEAGELDTIQGAALTIEGSGDDLMVNDGRVLCGNIPTVNATVFVIDTVLAPPEE